MKNREEIKACPIPDNFNPYTEEELEEMKNEPILANRKELNAWIVERVEKDHMITFVKGHNGYEGNINICAVCEATDEYFEYDWQPRK